METPLREDDAVKVFAPYLLGTTPVVTTRYRKGHVTEETTSPSPTGV